MQLAREAKTSDPLGRYYTESIVSATLARAMTVKSPKKVLDLGAGSGCLSAEASKIWVKATFVTVDIDRKARCALLPKTHGSAFNHFFVDALELSLAERLGLQWGQIDAAVCNPPYLRPQWRKHFSNILEDANLSHTVQKIGDVSADLLFVAQNLRMLISGGRLGLILSDGIIAGEKYAAFRKALVDMHCIEKVIELPRRAFKNTDAKAHIVVLSKDKNTNEYIPVQKLFQNGNLSSALNVPAEESIHRLDYSYLAGRANNRYSRTLGDAAERIVRGSFSSSDRIQLDFPVFHTTDFPKSSNSVPARFYLSKRQTALCEGILARHGDILIARVGRNLSSKVCKVNLNGFIAISDSVFLLRTSSNNINELFNFIKSENGRLELERLSQGVGAKFITSRSLGELRF